MDTSISSLGQNFLSTGRNEEQFNFKSMSCFAAIGIQIFLGKEAFFNSKSVYYIII